MAMNLLGGQSIEQLAATLLKQYPNVDPNLMLQQSRQTTQQQGASPWAAMTPEAMAALRPQQGAAPAASPGWGAIMQGMQMMPVAQPQQQMLNPGGGSGPGGGSPTQPVAYPQTAVPGGNRISLGQMLARLGG